MEQTRLNVVLSVLVVAKEAPQYSLVVSVLALSSLYYWMLKTHLPYSEVLEIVYYVMHWLSSLYIRPQNLVCSSLLTEKASIVVYCLCNWEQ